MHDRINRRISKSEDVLSGLEAWRILPEAEKRQKAMEGIDRKIREKRIMYSPSPVRLFLIQLQYIPFAFWLSQGAVLVSVVFLLCRTTLQQGGVMDYLWWGSVAAAWMGLMACGGLNRHLARGMVELEQSCYINMLQLEYPGAAGEDSSLSAGSFCAVQCLLSDFSHIGQGKENTVSPDYYRSGQRCHGDDAQAFYRDILTRLSVGLADTSDRRSVSVGGAAPLLPQKNC